MSTDEADREAFSMWMQESGNHSIADAFKAGLAHARQGSALMRALQELANKLVAAEDDQRATGEVLATLLGRERCVEGNICLANDVALLVERAADERDQDWIRALTEVLGTSCGVPTEPNVRALGRLFESVKLGAVTMVLKQQEEEAEQLTRMTAATSLVEAERGDRTQWQTGVEGHKPSCSRVSGSVPLACYIYIKDGTCTECGARVSLPSGVVKPPEPGAGAPESSEDDFITRKQLIEALRDIDSPEGTAVLLLLANRLEKT